MSKINFVYEYLYLGACLNYRLYQITTPDYIILQVCFFPPNNLIQGNQFNNLAFHAFLKAGNSSCYDWEQWQLHYLYQDL